MEGACTLPIRSCPPEIPSLSPPRNWPPDNLPRFLPSGLSAIAHIRFGKASIGPGRVRSDRGNVFVTIKSMKEEINYDDFTKLDIRVGTILVAEEIEGSDKLLRLDVDFGEEGKRQILSGIKKWYTPESLVGRQSMFVLNLAPRKMMGLESQGMIVAGHREDGGAMLYKFDEEVEPGSLVN